MRVQTIKQRPTGKLWTQLRLKRYRLRLIFKDQTRIYIDSFICHFFCLNVKMYEKENKGAICKKKLPDLFFISIIITEIIDLFY